MNNTPVIIKTASWFWLKGILYACQGKEDTWVSLGGWRTCQFIPNVVKRVEISTKI